MGEGRGEGEYFRKNGDKLSPSLESAVGNAQSVVLTGYADESIP
jgi:hypothetical protein